MAPTIKTPSIKTIARIAGTSVSSVSRVLNNSGYASPDLRERVERAIESLNYTPSRSARMLRGEPSRVVGLMVPTLDVPFFGILAQAVEQDLFERGCQTVICSTAENPEHEARYISLLRAQQVDGIIIASAFGRRAPFEALVEAGIPTVAIDRDLEGIAAASVMADHEDGGRQMARHLLALGHRRIGIAGAPGHSQPIALRLAGIRAELAVAGLEPAVVVTGEEHSFTATYALARQVLATEPRITALIGLTDVAAIAAIHAIRDSGARVPEDYSVIGFDDLPEAVYVLPRLTTIAQPIREVGVTATARLEHLIEQGRTGEGSASAVQAEERVRLAVTLVERQSTAPPRPEIS